MSLYCKVCNERLNLRKKQSFFEPRYISTRFCSFRCQMAGFRHIFLVLGTFLIAVYLAVGISLYLTIDLWLLLVVMIPFALLGLILFIAGFITLGIYVSIKRKQTLQRFYCFYCSSDVTETSKKGSLVCDSCGNKILYCNLCTKIINPQAEIAVIKPCNHAFHKNELLDFVEENKSCPKCHNKLEEISFKLERENEFWQKAK